MNTKWLQAGSTRAEYRRDWSDVNISAQRRFGNWSCAQNETRRWSDRLLWGPSTIRNITALLEEAVTELNSPGSMGYEL